MDQSRYSRLRRYSGFAGTIDRWQSVSCGIIGLGGLGGGLALQLSRMGVRQLVLIDRDTVEPENLGHQALYTEAHAGQALPKAHAAVETLSAINSSVDFVPRAAGLDRTTAGSLLDGCDLLFDGLDNYYTRLLLNDYALATGKPYFYAGVVRGEMSARAVIPGTTGCLRCMLDRPPAPGEVPTCAAEGVFGPLLGVANAVQIELANRWLAGGITVQDDLLYSLDITRLQLRRMPMGGPRAGCPACAGRHEYLDGTLDQLAAHSCTADHAEISVGTTLDLAAVESRLRASGADPKTNPFCLQAVMDRQRYTVFAGGRIMLEGGSPEDLNRFLATYLGI